MPRFTRMVLPVLGVLLGAVLWSASSAFAVDDSITISTNADNNVTCDAGTCLSTGTNANLSVATLETNLAGGDLTVGDGSQVTIESSIDSSSSNNLTFAGPVAIGPSSTESNMSIATGGSQDYGPVTLQSNVTFSADETVTFNNTVSGPYQLAIARGTVIVPASATVNSPVRIDSGGTLNCENGTLNGGVTNDGGKATGAPAAPSNAIASVSYRAASISFSPGAPNCFPVTYTATSGTLRFGPATGTPITATGLVGGQAYTFKVLATNPIGSSSTSSPSVIPAPYPPKITIASPVKDGTYVRGQIVKASYKCNDGTSEGARIASCTGSVASGTALNTQTLGVHTFTVAATSSGGARTTLSVTYTVLAAPASTATKPNKFTIKQLTDPKTGSVNVWLAGLVGAGTLKVTEHPTGLRAFTVHKTAGKASTFKFAVNPSSQLKQWLKGHGHSKLKVEVSIVYTPHGGKARTVTKTVSV